MLPKHRVRPRLATTYGADTVIRRRECALTSALMLSFIKYVQRQDELIHAKYWKFSVHRRSSCSWRPVLLRVLSRNSGINNKAWMSCERECIH